MNPKSPITQFISISNRNDWLYIAILPLIISAAISISLSFGEIVKVAQYLIDIVPVVSSILLGFLGMIMVASLSNNSIFDKMRDTPLTIKGETVSAYRVFFIGLFIDLLLFVILLTISLIFGSINSSLVLGQSFAIIEVTIILFFLISSSLLFIRNMDRVYQVTIHVS